MSIIIRRSNMTDPIPLDYSKMYLTFEMRISGSVCVKTNGTIGSKTFYYSLNGGEWTSVTSSSSANGTVTIGTFNAGDRIRLKGNNTTYATSKSNHMNFEGGTGYFDIYGNIMSMLYGDDFVGVDSLPTTYCFCSLFKLTKCYSAKHLILPALTLTEACYRALFSKSYCNVAPEILPATTLATYCYWYMFEECYFNTAPEMPFNGTVPTYAYGNMFINCSNLNYIKCLATNVVQSNAVTNWVSGVAASGTFVKNSSMNSWATGTSGIPSGWTVLSGEDCEISWPRLAYVVKTNTTNTIKLNNPHNVVVTYTSSNTSVATVSGSGKVTPISQGVTVITATFAGNETYYAKSVTCEIEVSNAYADQYLTIVSESDNNVIGWKCPYDNMYMTGKEIRISTNNGRTWISKQSSVEGTTLATLYTGDRMLIKGYNTGYGDYNAVPDYNSFTSTGKFRVEGNIMSMLYGDMFIHQYALPEYYTFYGLFMDCAHLTSASNLVLPATVLMCGCYESMFSGCISLVESPIILPALNLYDFCYCGMFYNCESLTLTPLLPATIVKAYSYSEMFNDCTSLETAPILRVSDIEMNGCSNMFNGCTNLNHIECYASSIDTDGTMYWVDGVAASGTFVKATSATWSTGVDGIPSGWTVIAGGDCEISWGQQSYETLVGNQDTPILLNPNNVPVTYSTSDSSIATIDVSSGAISFVGEGSCTLTASFAGDSVYQSKTVTCSVDVAGYYGDRYFTIVSRSDNNTISIVPEYPDYSYAYHVNLDISLDDGQTWTSISSEDESMALCVLNTGDKMLVKGDIFSFCDIYDSDRYCHFASTGDFDVEGNVMSLVYGDDFEEKTRFTYGSALSHMLDSCTHLINAHNLILPATTVRDMSYGYMFNECTSLITAPKLPATTLDSGCYYFMFNHCTSLERAPELPAQTLAGLCYFGMFNECTSLNYVKCLATDKSASYCTDCWLDDVAPNGTFVKASGTSWSYNENGVPSGWVVVDA